MLLRVSGGCSADHCFSGYLHLSEAGDSLVVVGRVSGGYGDHSEVRSSCLEGRVAFLDPGN